MVFLDCLTAQGTLSLWTERLMARASPVEATLQVSALPSEAVLVLELQGVQVLELLVL